MTSLRLGVAVGLCFILALACSSSKPGGHRGDRGAAGAADATGGPGAGGTPSTGEPDGGAAGGGQSGGTGGGAGGCRASTDPVQWSCFNGDVQLRIDCAPPVETKRACPYGCNSGGGFELFDARVDCNPAPDGGDAAPDAGTDAPLGTFVMCDDHADFNGRGRCAATGKVGAVFARQSRSAGGATTSLTAVFGTTTPPWEAGCTRASVGGFCTAVVCPRAVAPVAGAGAGAITAKSNGGALVTRPDDVGAYDVAQLSRALWSLPKAALAFSAAGGTTSAFGETFCGPPPVAMKAPTGVPGAGLTINRASDLTVQWTSAPVGDLELVLRDDETSSTSNVEVQCFFPGAAGQGTVPSTALSKIGPGLHGVASFIWVRKIGFGSGGTCSELTAIQTNDAAGGAPFNGTATFQ